MKNFVRSFRCVIAVMATGTALPLAAAEMRPGGSTWTIIQSARNPLTLVGVAAARRAPGARVLSGSDCTEFRDGIYVLARPGNTRQAGKPLTDSYVKRCTPKAGSVAALGLPAVDPSFFAMRDTPVNFDGADIVTTIRSKLLLRPWYLAKANDPREGLRMAVEDVSGPRRLIERDCSEAEVARNGRYIAIACAVEQVGERPLYRTSVYRAGDLARIRSEQRCHRPKFVAERILECTAQQVGPEGHITERQRRVTV